METSTIVVAVVGVAGGFVVEWVRGRGARELATTETSDSRERRLQEGFDALIEDYRERLASVCEELDRESKLRRALARQVQRLERERRHVHARRPKKGRG